MRPLVAFSGSTFWVDVYVPRDDRHRRLRLEAVPDLAVSELDLEGARAPARFSRQWIAGVPGEYTVIASVLDARARVLAQVRQVIIVVE